MTHTESILLYKDQIEAALSYGFGHNFDTVLGLILTGHVKLYCNKTSFMLMEVVTYPLGKVYHCFLGGGNEAELAEILPDIFKDAEALDCVKVTLTGRVGFSRGMRKYGFKTTHALVSKDV